MSRCQLQVEANSLHHRVTYLLLASSTCSSIEIPTSLIEIPMKKRHDTFEAYAPSPGKGPHVSQFGGGAALDHS